MPSESGTESAVKSAAKANILVDFTELRLQSPEGMCALLARVVQEAKERGDEVARQQLLRHMRLHLVTDESLAGHYGSLVWGKYVPFAPGPQHWHQRPSISRAVTQMPPAPMPQASGGMLDPSSVPIPVMPTPIPMAFGTAPVPFLSNQGPNHSQPMTLYHAAKRTRSVRSDKGQPKPKKRRALASSSQNVATEPASKRQRTISPAHTQGLAQQVGAASAPSVAEKSVGDAPINGLFEGETLGFAQRAIPDSFIDPALRNQGQECLSESGEGLSLFNDFLAASEPGTEPSSESDLIDWVNDPFLGMNDFQFDPNLPPFDWDKFVQRTARKLKLLHPLRI